MLQELTQAIEDTARAVVGEIHTAIPGRFLSFDASEGTAKVQPIGKYVTSDETEMDYPILTEVPVLFPFCQSSGIGMAFPIHKGDSCLLIISEVELDAWRNGAESEGSLRFDLTNAFAVPGPVKGYSSLVRKAASQEAVIIRAGSNEIMVSEAGIAVGGNLNVTGNITYTGSIYRA